jgi:hypothetical protein
LDLVNKKINPKALSLSWHLMPPHLLPLQIADPQNGLVYQNPLIAFSMFGLSSPNATTNGSMKMI